MVHGSLHQTPRDPVLSNGKLHSHIVFFKMAIDVCSLALASEEVAHLPDLSLPAFGLQKGTTLELKPDYFHISLHHISSHASEFLMTWINRFELKKLVTVAKILVSV